MSSPAAKRSYAKARDAFDLSVSGLSPDEYKWVIDELAAHLEACNDCLKSEQPQLFEDQG